MPVSGRRGREGVATGRMMPVCACGCGARVDWAADGGSTPEPSGCPPMGMGSRERMTAQTGTHGGEVTEVVSDPLSLPQGAPQQVIHSRDEVSRVR